VIGHNVDGFAYISAKTSLRRPMYGFGTALAPAHGIRYIALHDDPVLDMIGTSALCGRGAAATPNPSTARRVVSHSLMFTDTKPSSELRAGVPRRLGPGREGDAAPGAGAGAA
jgi:hypothetical protein